MVVGIPDCSLGLVLLRSSLPKATAGIELVLKSRPQLEPVHFLAPKRWALEVECGSQEERSVAAPCPFAIAVVFVTLVVLQPPPSLSPSSQTLPLLLAAAIDPWARFETIIENYFCQLRRLRGFKMFRQLALATDSRLCCF